MELNDLGWDAWFQQRRDERERTELRPARVTAVHRNSYLVRNESGEVRAEATGRLLFGADSGEDLPCVGDWALVEYHNGDTFAIIHDVLPRKTFLRRKAAGRKVDVQMLAANLDGAFIVQACDADFNLRRLERYLVAAKEGGIEPTLLFSKTDLIRKEQLEQLIASVHSAHISAPIVTFSNYSQEGLSDVRAVLVRGKTYCLLGSPGVGKTTLLNHLLGEERYDTAPVREKDGRGRHTTARRQLSLLENGALLIDTPGLRELGMMAEIGSIDESFPDIAELASRCRFNDCTHTQEAGCAIQAALQNGDLSEERYRSYVKLRRESAFRIDRI